MTKKRPNKIIFLRGGGTNLYLIQKRKSKILKSRKTIIWISRITYGISNI